MSNLIRIMDVASPVDAVGDFAADYWAVFLVVGIVLFTTFVVAPAIIIPLSIKNSRKKAQVQFDSKNE